MDISLFNYADTLASLQRARGAQAYDLKKARAQEAEETALPVIVSTSTKNTQNTGTKLLSETREDLPDGGYRRTRTFEQDAGRTFTRVEEFTLTERGARRSVIQQNPSGAITQYEEVLDRQDSGAFRRTQRFRDEAGDIATHITADYAVNDPFILTGGEVKAAYPLPAFSPSRGTQLDLQA